MSKSRSELVNEISDVLGVNTPNQALSADDYNRIDGIINPSLALLASEDVIVIDDSQEFDEAVFLPLSVYIAAQAAPKYGTSIDASAARMTLRRVARPGFSNRLLTTDPIFRIGTFTQRYR